MDKKKEWEAYAKGKQGNKKLAKAERKQAKQARNWRKQGKHFWQGVV